MGDPVPPRYLVGDNSSHAPACQALAEEHEPLRVPQGERAEAGWGAWLSQCFAQSPISHSWEIGIRATMSGSQGSIIKDTGFRGRISGFSPDCTTS